MSESIIKAIGRKQCRMKKTLIFVLLCNRESIKWQAEISIEDLHNILKAISKTILLLPVFSHSKLDSFESDYLDSIQQEISDYFYKLRFREDIFCHPAIQNLLSIPLFPLPIEYASSFKVSSSCTLSHFLIIPSQKSIIASSEYLSLFKGIGKLWTLIEAQSLGEISLLGFDESLYKLQTISTQDQIKCVYWKENSFEAIFGLESGGMVLAKFRLKLGANSKGVFDGDKLYLSEHKVIKIHNDRVLGIAGFEDVLISISLDSILKISKCQEQNLDPVGGGSLKQRLSSDKLACIAMDPITKKVFLGSERGKIMIYVIEDFVPKYLHTIACELKVKEIDVHWGTIFVASGSFILAFPDSKVGEVLARFQPDVENAEINTLKYLREKDQVFAGYSNGMLLIWHAVIFQLVLAVKIFEESIAHLEVDSLNGILAVSNCYNEIKIFRI